MMRNFFFPEQSGRDIILKSVFLHTVKHVNICSV